ncbi:hypothetical protein BHM03_00057870 [Ensete ventricosum]|nr:hypothetical protein BHM03_00057870 [Ensete ventricosum]
MSVSFARLLALLRPPPRIAGVSDPIPTAAAASPKTASPLCGSSPSLLKVRVNLSRWFRMETLFCSLMARFNFFFRLFSACFPSFFVDRRKTQYLVLLPVCATSTRLVCVARDTGTCT